MVQEMTITHLTREETEDKLHISYLMKYVSAYEPTREQVEELSESLEEALKEAKRDIKTVIVDQDGECCFHVTPSGYIILMLPWKKYKVWEDKK